MHILLSPLFIVFLSFVCDIFYFFVTHSLLFHFTVCTTLYFIFFSFSFSLLATSFLLLGCLGSLIYHSYTIYLINVGYWLMLLVSIKKYIGNKSMFLLGTLTGILVTHTILLYFSIFKPMITPFYTFTIISCNIGGMYLALLKFPIVEQGNRL